MEITPGIRRLGSGMVNVYLVEEAGSVTVIDAGVGGYWRDLEAELAGIGRSLADVRAVVLTHAHSDHIGFAERLRRREVTVRVHADDAALARGEVKPVNEGGPQRVLPVLRFLLYGLRKGGLRTAHVGEVSTFDDGATLDVPGSPRVIHVPGHTPGSAALHVPSRDVVFVGDAFVTLNVMTGETGPRLFPNFSADNRQAFESLARLDGLEAGLVLPGHGEPWTGGLEAALAAVRYNGSPR
jgi:glyoxylase-like metal-dependent hydrolase (beta-lactamase superfamily II)